VTTIRLVRELDGRRADPDAGTALALGVLPMPKQERLKPSW